MAEGSFRNSAARRFLTRLQTRISKGSQVLGLRHVSSRHIIITVAILNFLMVVIGYITRNNPTKFYREGAVGTHISILLLALIGFVSFRIFLHRRRYAIWLLISLGFVFLAFDEGLLIHERLDEAFHQYFGITETRLTDRLDDILIALYGLVGAWVLYLYRKELLRFRALLRFLMVGFACLAASVVLDLATNDNVVFLWLGIPDANIPDYKLPLRALEEVFKLMAEAVFLAGFVQVLRQVSASDS